MAGAARAGRFGIQKKRLSRKTALIKSTPTQFQTVIFANADESRQDFDELLIERNRYGAVWVHFAVRPKDNRHKVSFINA